MIRKYLERRVRSVLEERGGYTTLLTAGLEATAAGTVKSVLTTGAVEAAAGLWGRTLAAPPVSRVRMR